MATLERELSSDTEPQYQKYSLRRLEPAIQRFLSVVQTDLKRLDQHRNNVEKFNRLKDWKSLHTEQINATRTVQQVKANIHEIERSRMQVEEEDLPAFDKKVDAMKHKAILSVKEFVELTCSSKDQVSHSSSDSSPSDDHDFTQEVMIHGHLQLNDLPENTEVAESWDHLQENLEELNTMVHQFATAVNDQQEKLDTIEANVEDAHSSVQDGVKQLGKASHYAAAIFPIAGAVIGTVVAGPVGLVAGAKLGGILGAVGGGTAGFIGGRVLKGRQEEAKNIELSNLSRTNSLPDIPTEEPERTSQRNKTMSESHTALMDDS